MKAMAFGEIAAVLLVGLLAGLLLLEVGLRAGQLVQEKRYELRKTSGNEYVVLCLGDSYVYGSGVPQGEAYPAQLERLLNTSLKRTCRVVNGGIQAQTSSMLVDALPASIAKVKPDLVIVLTGGANMWHCGGYARHATGTVLPGKRVFPSIADMVYNSAVYKLATLLGDDLKDKSDARMAEAKEKEFSDVSFSGDYEQGIRYFNEAIAKDPHNSENYWRLGYIYDNAGRYPEAIGCLERGIAVNPLESKYFVGIGYAYFMMGDLRKALDYYKKATTAGPAIDDNYYRLVEIGRKEAYSGETLAFLRELEGKDRDNHLALDAIEMIKARNNSANANVRQWVEADIREAVRLCHQKKIGIILMNYPCNKPEFNYPLRSIPILFPGIPFVDNNRIFEELLRKNPHKDYFIPNGHCNAEGNRIVAEKVYETIMKYDLISINRGATS
jgi:tetratricopeptide (TPR) repeat protein